MLVYGGLCMFGWVEIVVGVVFGAVRSYKGVVCNLFCVGSS